MKHEAVEAPGATPAIVCPQASSETVTGSVTGARQVRQSRARTEGPGRVRAVPWAAWGALVGTLGAAMARAGPGRLVGTAGLPTGTAAVLPTGTVTALAGVTFTGAGNVEGGGSVASRSGWGTGVSASWAGVRVGGGGGEGLRWVASTALPGVPRPLLARFQAVQAGHLHPWWR